VLPLAIALALAGHVAPQVAPDTLVTFAKQESGLHPLAIHDNTSGETYSPDTEADAVALAIRLILREGHRVDLGLLQVDFTGPTREGLSIRDAFDPAASMRTGASILVADYRTCQGREAAQEAALRCAAALYNAGAETPAGRSYAARIWQTAKQVVPSIGRIMSADFPVAAPGTADIVGARLVTTNVTVEPREALSATPQSSDPTPMSFALPIPAGPFSKPVRTGREIAFTVEGK
jgi:type IV secretion system protein VirB1